MSSKEALRSAAEILAALPVPVLSEKAAEGLARDRLIRDYGSVDGSIRWGGLAAEERQKLIDREIAHARNKIG